MNEFGQQPIKVAEDFLNTKYTSAIVRSREKKDANKHCLTA